MMPRSSVILTCKRVEHLKQRGVKYQILTKTTMPNTSEQRPAVVAAATTCGSARLRLDSAETGLASACCRSYRSSCLAITTAAFISATAGRRTRPNCKGMNAQINDIAIHKTAFQAAGAAKSKKIKKRASEAMRGSQQKTDCSPPPDAASLACHGPYKIMFLQRGRIKMRGEGVMVCISCVRLMVQGSRGNVCKAHVSRLVTVASTSSPEDMLTVTHAWS